jgi:hypothetical protein
MLKRAREDEAEGGSMSCPSSLGDGLGSHGREEDEDWLIRAQLGIDPKGSVDGRRVRLVTPSLTY